MNNYIPVIGLEIHVELSTKSKMFCGCPADWFGKAPNSQTCPVCLGLPGALPVANKQAIKWTIKIAQALECTVPNISKFDRKHYFYPDLSKSFQLSQYDEPIGQHGSFSVHFDSIENKKKFRIRRVHLEEDAGKLIHDGKVSLVDYNRSGVPLVEIVTEPDFHDSSDVKRFLEELQTLIRSLGVSDVNMEEGSMRLEPNISVARRGGEDREIGGGGGEEEKLGGGVELPNYKVEVKNINSFKFVKNAIDYEVTRHIEILEKGETPVQETRGYVEATGKTISQRSKEEAHDYRYFPEPDIPQLEFSEEEKNPPLPELPTAQLEKYVNEPSIKFEDAFIITHDPLLINYFEQLLVILIRQPAEKDLGVVTPAKLASMLVNKRISSHDSPEVSIQKASTATQQVKTDEVALSQSITKVVQENEKAVSDYKSGKETVIMFLVGKVMKEMNGQADPSLVKERLTTALKK